MNSLQAIRVQNFYAVATDEELKIDTNPDGKLKQGEDTINQTKFTVLDYQTSDFLGAETDMAMTITYRAEDKVGNVTTKMVTVYLADTTAQEFIESNGIFGSQQGFLLNFAHCKVQ